MITRLKIENFKSIGSPGLDVELKPLTILVGPNGSGKSNIMQALAFLGAQAGFQIEKTLRVGETMVVTRTSEMLDMIHQRDPRKWLTLETHMIVDDERAHARLVQWLKRIDPEKLGIEIPGFRIIGYKFSWKNEGEECRQSVFMGGQEIMRVAHLYDSEERKVKDTCEFPKLLRGQHTAHSPLHILVPRVFASTGEIREAKGLMGLAEEIVSIIASQVKRKAFLISTLRGDVPYSPETRQPPPAWVGVRGENLVQILSLLGQRKYKKKREKVMKWAGRFGLVDVSGTWSGYDKLVSDYADPDLGTALNSALASHGSKQMLSVIVQLFWSDSRDLIMIEEPEISLHPDSQALLPQLFAEAMSEGKQIIITTHSEFFLLALSRPIRNKLIKPNDIAVYHVTKDSKGTHAEPLEVTAEGYVQGWVLSFAETERKLIQEWLQTLPEEE